MVTREAAERFLAAPCLHDADSAARQAVLNVLIERHEPAGTVLLTQGRRNDRIVFLIGGTVQVYRDYENGRVEEVARLNAPSVFGETSFFRPLPPIASAKAVTDVWLLTMDHEAHAVLRRVDPRAAEQLALAAVRVLAERFELLDQKVSDYLRQHPEGPARANEWSSFRARLFEESSL